MSKKCFNDSQCWPGDSCINNECCGDGAGVDCPLYSNTIQNNRGNRLNRRRNLRFSGYNNAKGTGCGRCNRTQYRIDNNIPLSTQNGDYTLTYPESEWVLNNQPCNTGCKCNRYENPIGRPSQGQYRYECERKMATPTRFSRFAGQETGGGEVMSVQDFINDIP